MLGAVHPQHEVAQAKYLDEQACNANWCYTAGTVRNFDPWDSMTANLFNINLASLRGHTESSNNLTAALHVI